MSPATVLIFCATLAGVGTGSAVLSQLNADSSTSVSIGGIITRFLTLLGVSAFGMYAAQQSGVRGSLIVTSEDRHATIRDLMIHGVLPGFVLGVANYLLFFRYRYSTLVQSEIRDMESFYDAALISLNSAMAEEILFRLFTLSALLFFLKQVYTKILHVWPFLASLLPGALALVVSSLMFAIAHNVYGFTAAFVGGLVLGVLFLRGGVESAIAAHFVANLLFFSAAYLA